MFTVNVGTAALSSTARGTPSWKRSFASLFFKVVSNWLSCLKIGNNEGVAVYKCSKCSKIRCCRELWKMFGTGQQKLVQFVIYQAVWIKCQVKKLWQMLGEALRVLQWPVEAQSCCPLGGGSSAVWSFPSKTITPTVASDGSRLRRCFHAKQKVQINSWRQNFKRKRMLVVTAQLCSSLIFSLCL